MSSIYKRITHGIMEMFFHLPKFSIVYQCLIQSQNDKFIIMLKEIADYTYNRLILLEGIRGI